MAPHFEYKRLCRSRTDAGTKNSQRDDGLSILVLAHTPKRPFARPLTVNDLAGSKQLSNFTDTMFAIGDSIQGSNIRYLKTKKQKMGHLLEKV